MLRDIYVRNRDQANFRLFCPDETNSNRLGNVFEVENRCFVGRDAGHRRPPLARRPRHGGAERAPVRGLARGLPAHRSARPVRDVRGVRHGLRVDDRAAHQVAPGSAEPAWRAPVASLNILLTSTCWRNDHNGFSHQGPGLIDVMLSKRGTVARIYLPPDANCLLSVADHCLRSRDYVNLIVIDKQPQLQYFDDGAGHRALRARRVDPAHGPASTTAASRTSCWAAAGRHSDARDGGGGLVAAPARARPAGARRQRRRPDAAVPGRAITRTA